MERGTKTTAAALQVGDRFYKAVDKTKTVLQMVEHTAKSTKYQTYSLWYLPPNTDAKYPKAIKGDTEVIFLRHTE